MDGCPSDDDLARFVFGDGAGSVGPHLRECALCQATLERLSDDGSLRPRAASSGGSSWDWSVDPEVSRIVEALEVEAPALPQRASGGETSARSVVLDPTETLEMVGRLGPYDVEEVVGRGGMGVVFRAHDRTTGQVVALKVLNAGADDERLRRRFIQEVRAAARVEHDNVVRLYATSDPTERVPYFAMEYLAGPSLADEIVVKGRIDAREAAEIVAQAASGLQAAHAAGLVHSDVKPANILLDPATGRAKVGDFGLARLISGATKLSRDGLLPGTPAYLSPEQARGESEPDARTDVYSLGVSLYECLAGEVPFRGEPHRIIQQVLVDEPRAPRDFNESIPRDLETICLKAMAKEPARRYATASEFACDLRRFLRGEPIVARPAGPIERSWRWCRNNSRVAGLIALAGLLLVALAAGSLVAALWVSRAKSVAVEQARQAQAQRALALDTLSSLIEGIQGQLATRPGTLELRRSLLEQARTGLSRVARGQSLTDRTQVDVSTIKALVKLGDIELLLGRAAEARGAFDEAAEMGERVSSADPKSIPLRRELAASYDRLGDLVISQYASEGLAEQYEKAHAIRRALVAEHPDDAAIRRDLRVSQGKMGDAEAQAGHLEKTRVLYDTYLKSLLAEPTEGSNRVLNLSDLRFIYGRIGKLAEREGRAPEALEALRACLAQAEALCAIDPENPTYRRQRAFASDYLGEACTDFGDLEGAEKALSFYLADRKAASAADPSDRDVSRALALAHQHVGDLAARRLDFEVGREAYHKGLTLFEDLAKGNPTSVQAHKDRMIALRKLFSIEALAGRLEEAALWAKRELDAQSSKDVPPHQDHAGMLDEIRTLYEVYRLARQSINDPTFSGTQPPLIASGLIKARAQYLARYGRDTAAAEAAGEVLALTNDPDAPLIAARAYSLAAQALPGDRAESRSSYIRASIKALRVAVTAKPWIARKIQYDPALAAVRDDPEFKVLTHHSL